MKRSKLLGIVCVIAMVGGLLVAGCAGEAPLTEAEVFKLPFSAVKRALERKQRRGGEVSLIYQY